MERATDGAVVARILGYLEQADASASGHLTGARPLDQSVRVRSAWWRDHLADKTFADPVRLGVDAAISCIADAGDTVDRQLLTRLAAESDAGDAARVTSWFTTMCWGAGPTDNFRVRQWRQALEQPYFISVLHDTAQRTGAGQLYEAHRSAWMKGTGEAFFTKWLWALGLAGVPGDVQPHVLDARVWNSLAVLGWWPEGTNASHRWVDYCRALDRWASELRDQQPGWAIDGDHIEQLLFERRNDRTDFHSWGTM
jgi:hypothetical protein